MTVFSRPLSRRILVVAKQDDPLLPYWTDGLRFSGFDIHFFPLGRLRPLHDLSNVTIHRLFAPLRPRLMLHLLWKDPEQLLLHFPNYEFLLRRKFQTEIVYPLFHVELPGGPARAISALLRKTGSVTDIRPGALARVIKRIKPDLVVSVGLEDAAAVTLRARARIGPEFPAWLLCARKDIESNVNADKRSEAVQIFSAVDFFAYEEQADVAVARKLGLTGLPLPVAFPIRIDVDQLAHRMPLPPSQRRTIMIDCRGDPSEAAALDALGRCAELLQDYMTVVCGAPQQATDKASERVMRTGRFPVMRAHEPSIVGASRLMGVSRIYIAVPQHHGPYSRLIQAAAMGAFPIQICDPDRSNLEDHHLSGLAVAATDADGFKAAVTRALTDGNLVDQTAATNLAVARRRYSISSVDAVNQRRELFDEIFVGPRATRVKDETAPAAKEA